MDDGLWSLPADYHASNFYPQVLDFAQTRYGAFVQLWATTYGRGRILAFTDSTTYNTGVVFHAISYGVAAAATQPPVLSGLAVLPLDGPVFETTAGNALGFVQSVTIGTTGVISVSGTVWYDEI